MNKGTKQMLRATFSNGETMETQDCRFTVAFRCSGIWDGKPAQKFGFGFDEASAKKNAQRFLLGWQKTTVEFVKLTPTE